MRIGSIKELLDQIYNEINSQNNFFDAKAIPASDVFYQQLAKKYELIPFNIPELLTKLADSHKIFIFNIVDEDLKKKVVKVQGFVVSKGDVISKLRKCYEDELLKAYLTEFNEKISIEKVIEKLVPKMDEINNTPVGRLARIVLKLLEFEMVIEKEILQYSKRKQDELLQKQIESCKAINSYVIEAVDNGNGTPGTVDFFDGPEEKSRAKGKHRPNDTKTYNKIKMSMSQESVASVLSVYGIEFFTRICFREYQFLFIVKLIQDGKIHKEEHLQVIKKFLQKERMSSDQDPNIQKFAAEINALEKVVNTKLSFF